MLEDVLGLFFVVSNNILFLIGDVFVFYFKMFFDRCKIKF